MSNRLADEQSPYLLQHKDNPVDWYPWGEEAFAKAREEDKPIFLSIGYSTCHWCHVMEEESFEDEEVAEKMNEAFVSIKVDREERPDVDSIYMNVCQMMRGQGGWPLTVLMTPDRRPFYAATYLPKHGRMQRMGMMELVPRVEELWEENREKLLQDANEVTDLLQRSVKESAGGRPPGEEDLDDAYAQLAKRFDTQHGGFGSQPKFPAPHNLLFLLRRWHRTGDDRPLEMAVRTLHAMRLGGIFDQVGFGFHRYSTDREWLLPHFEKMLYDQAMHVTAYAEAHQVTGDNALAETAENVATYVLRDLRAPEGAFYSAEDADSLTPEGEREEGAFYVWTTDELRDVLDADLAALVIDVYNCSEDGNYRDESTRAKTGANILHLTKSLSQIAAERDVDEAELRERLETARTQLYDRRETRARPGLDDKILTDWNGLMIGALATLGRAVDDASYVQAAEEAAELLLETLRDDEGRLLHRYRNGDAAIRAHLEDYAALVWGLVQLYRATFEPRWLEAACDEMDACIEHFWDAADGGFYQTADDAERLIVRQKELHDGAQPSGNSLQMHNLTALARLTGRTAYDDRADALAAWAGKQVTAQASGFTGFLMGLQFALDGGREVVIAEGEGSGAEGNALVEVLQAHYAPFTVVHRRTPATADALDRLAPYTEPHGPVDGQPAAYVCRNFTCDLPVTDPEALAEALGE